MPKWQPCTALATALICLLLAPVCRGEKAVKSKGEQECRQFVQVFYDWYTAPVAKDKTHPLGIRDVGDVLALKSGLFDKKLLRLLRDDRNAQRHAHEIVGIDFDPFLNSQDPSPRFRVQSLQANEQNCHANVWGIDGETHRETVLPVLEKSQQGWKFKNFEYREENGSSIPDLITQLQRLQQDRATNRPR